MDKSKWPLWCLALYAHLGEREQSPGDNGAIMQFSSILKAMDIATNDEVPWCAAAVGASLERAGIGSTRSLLAKSYLQWGAKAFPAALEGAIAVFDRPPDPNAGHVGFVVDWNTAGDWVDILGGNQDNRVSIARFKFSEVRALRWPDMDDRLSPTFELALKHILGPDIEGGWSDDPEDPGGPTNMGITLGTLQNWRPGATKDHLRALTPQERDAIYVCKYWFKAWCDQLPPALAVMHFDCAVNQGPADAARFLQEAVGADIDGEIGPKTIAMSHAADLQESLLEYAAIRESDYRSLPKFPHYGGGWLNRLAKTRNLAFSLVPQSPTPAPQQQPAQPKEQPMDAPQAQATPETPTPPAAAPKPALQSMTVWGALLTFASAVLPAVAGAYGIPVTPEMVTGLGSEAATALQAMVGLLGTGMTIYGRMRARGPVKLA